MTGLSAVLAAGDDQQKAAPLGLFVLLLLGLACYFLFRSMSRHLKRVREDFPLGIPPGAGSTSPAISRDPTAPAGGRDGAASTTGRDASAPGGDDAVPPAPR